MKTAVILTSVMCVAFIAAGEANAQAVSSGMLSGPSAGLRKKIAVQHVPRASEAAKPRRVATRRAQPDPVTTGSISAKPKN